MNNITPAQLWVGEYNFLEPKLLSYFKNIFCKKKIGQTACNLCIDCIKIDKKKHYSLFFIEPEGQYVLSDLDSVFVKLAFQLDYNEKFFFIFKDAQFLGASCSAALLKSIEEPPTGYNFIFICQKLELVLGTIRSRCLVFNFGSEHEVKSHAIINIFKDINNFNPILLAKVFEQQKITEIESIVFLDQLLNYWSDQYKHAVLNKSESALIIKINKVVLLISDAIQKGIMPGSSKLFWRDLYLKIFLS